MSQIQAAMQFKFSRVPGKPMDAHEFIGLADTLAPRLDVSEPWDVRFEDASQSQERKRFQQSQEWRERLVANWEGLFAIDLATYKDPGTRIVRWIVPNQIVEVSAIARPGESPDKLLERLTSGLDLHVLTFDPFRYRRSAVVYRPQGWSRAGFIVGIRSILELANEGRPVNVHDAYITYRSKKYNNFEELAGLHDLESFFKKLNELKSVENKIHTIHLRFSGAVLVENGKFSGFAIGITVSLFPEPCEVTVRSTLDPEDLRAPRGREQPVEGGSTQTLARPAQADGLPSHLIDVLLCGARKHLHGGNARRRA